MNNQLNRNPMKTSSNYFKTGLIGLLLTLATTLAFAQVTPSPNIPVAANADLKTGMLNDLGTAVLNADAVLFFNPSAGTSFTLTASEMDEAGENTFTDYAWYPVAAGGTADMTTSLSAVRTLERTNMQPGYHRFRVYGFVNTAGIDCQSEEYQDFIVFILNPLQPTATNVGAITEYCLGDTGTFELEANVALELPYENADFDNPTATELELTYHWFAVLDGDNANPIALTPTATPTAGGTSTAIFDFGELTAAGTYTFYVEVAYSSAIKDKGARPEGHGFWRASVMNGASTYEIEVTPRPGRPTITIGSITD